MSEETRELGEVLERGIRNCTICGKPHNCHRRGEKGRTWESPDDGHTYRQEHWSTFARRVTEKTERLERALHDFADLLPPDRWYLLQDDTDKLLGELRDRLGEPDAR